MACQLQFDATKYLKYLGDTNLNEDTVLDYMQDIVEEVAYETKIFKDIFKFNIDVCNDMYNFKDLYMLYQTLKEKIVSPVITDYTQDQLVNILVGKEFIDNSICDNEISQDSDVNNTSTDKCYNTYMNIIDVLHIDKDINSVISRWFTFTGSNLYKLNKDVVISDLGYEPGVDNPLELIGYVSIIPNVASLTEEDEVMLRQVFINGLKFIASDRYMNATNEQVSNIYYQRYYNSKKQLAFNLPQFISNIKVKNADWNI